MKQRRMDGSTSLAAAAAAIIGLALAASVASAESGGDHDGPCTLIAEIQARACAAEMLDDFYSAKAICVNIEDRQERRACLVEARVANRDGNMLCRRQEDAREDLCEELGDERYDPDFDPALFQSDFSHPSATNPYFPLSIGNEWEFSGEEETVSLRVEDVTKSIEGVTCIQLNDVVRVDGVVHEDTDDWYGQRLDGTVDYCGESVRDYELFEGDAPQDPELVNINGSWKMGRDGSLAGTQMPGAPTEGMVYRQEWSPSNAEDAARILSTEYGYGDDADLDRFVPEALADLFCEDDDCLVIEEFSPVEPSAIGRKYYARGIGQFLEVKPATGATVALVDCNFDPRCESLPGH